MNINVEQLENKMAKLTIELEPDVLEKAIDDVYKKQRNRINVPGFRKGKAPRVIIEKMYGSAVFYEDAADLVIKEQYPNAYDECGLEIVSQPEIEITQLEKGKPFIFTAMVALRPDVTLGKYKGVTVTKIDTAVTDDMINDELKRMLRSNGRNVEADRPVEDGDIVNIDYVGKTDGEEFEGGNAEGYNLTIGSHSFIPGFEEQLIGKEKEQTFDIDVTFPEEYHAPELAGKPAVFTVTINTIRYLELPELTDEYVQDVSEFETVDEYKADIKKRLEERKEREAKNQKVTEAIDKIVKDSKMDISEPMLDTQVERMMSDYAQSLMQQGISIQQYFQMTGMSADMLREQMRPTAEDQLRSSLVLEEVAKAEGIEATDDDIKSKLEEMGAMYKLDPEEMFGHLTEDDKKRMKKEIQVEKAADFIGDNVKERAKPKKKSVEEKED